MKKLNKKLLGAISLFSIIFILIVSYSIYEWYNPSLYIKEFDSVSADYQKIVSLLRGYYISLNSQEDIMVEVDKKNYVILYNEIIINMTEDEMFSLKRICETSYPGYYNFIWVSENDIIFWEDETKMYAVMYTTDFKKSKSEIKEWCYKDVKFKRINEQWYEFGYFGI